MQVFEALKLRKRKENRERERTRSRTIAWGKKVCPERSDRRVRRPEKRHIYCCPKGKKWIRKYDLASIAQVKEGWSSEQKSEMSRARGSEKCAKS